MVDDLDDVLQELETKHSTCNTLPPKDEKFRRSELLNDVNNILATDFDDEPNAASALEGEVKLGKIKCCPVFIGGADLSVGSSDMTRHLTRPKTCSSLHCRNCDFKVVSFPNFEWTENVEYLFLRTNMPSSKKIFDKLRRKDNSVAYACHCVAYSAEEQFPLHLIQTLPWFCRGHTLQN